MCCIPPILLFHCNDSDLRGSWLEFHHIAAPPPKLGKRRHISFQKQLFINNTPQSTAALLSSAFWILSILGSAWNVLHCKWMCEWGRRIVCSWQSQNFTQRHTTIQFFTVIHALSFMSYWYNQYWWVFHVTESWINEYIFPITYLSLSSTGAAVVSRCEKQIKCIVRVIKATWHFIITYLLLAAIVVHL